MRIDALVKGLVLLLAAGLVLAGAGGARAAEPALATGKLEIRTPTVAFPYYHFTLPLMTDKPDTVVKLLRLTANGELVLNHTIIEADELRAQDKPRNRRRMVIAQVLKSSRPEQSYENPVLVGRLDWRDGEQYAINVAATFGEDGGTTRGATLKAAAPASGGYWDENWEYYQSVVLTETAGEDRHAEPVEVTMMFYPGMLAEGAADIRVVRYDWRAGRHEPVPSQLIDFARSHASELPMYDEKGERKVATFVPSESATIVFPADVPAGASEIYLVFHGNPAARAEQLSSDLKVSGDAPGRIVENNYYRAALHRTNGMLDELAMKSKPQYSFVHKMETNGAVQWNPDAYAPPRGWAHLSDWDPEKFAYQYEETLGPVLFRTRRWGDMPMMPELASSMEYAFYAGAPWFTMRSSMLVRHEMAVQALRNSEIVFARDMFREAAWPDPIHGGIHTVDLLSAPDLTEWTMPDDTPWIAFFDREKGVGFAGIQRSYANGGIEGRLRGLNPYMYVTVGPWIYWTRALAYPYGSHNPQLMIPIARGSVYLEEWAYLPFELKGSGVFAEVERWRNKLAHPLVIKLVDPIDARMEVPKEIYIEPQAATGWEEKKEQ